MVVNSSSSYVVVWLNLALVSLLLVIPTMAVCYSENTSYYGLYRTRFTNLKHNFNSIKQSPSREADVFWIVALCGLVEI